MKKRKKLLFFSICLVFIISSLTMAIACSEPAPEPVTEPVTEPEPVKSTKLTAANYLPPTNIVVETLETFGADLSDRSNGMYHVEVVSGGALVPMPGSYDAIVGGVADIALFPPPMTEKPFPMTELPVMYWGPVPSETMSKAWFNSVYKQGYLDAELDEIKPLMAFVGTVGDIATINPINSLAELEGVKLANAQGPICIELMDRLGAVSVLGGPPDVYQMLEKGIAEGEFVSALGIKEFHWADFVNYALPIKLSHMSHIVGMNLDVYNKMPDDVKKIVDEMSMEEKYSMITPRGHDEYYESAVQYFHDEGGTDITWSDADMAKLNEVAGAIWEEEMVRLEGEGYPAREICDVLYNAMKDLGVAPADIAVGYTPGG